MKKWIILLVLILLMCACTSSRRNIRSEVKSNLTTQISEQSQQNTETTESDRLQATEDSSIIDKSITTITETEYSAPDSLGHQYKTKERIAITMNDRRKCSSSRSELLLEKSSDTLLQEQTESHIASKSNQLNSEHISTRTRTPWAAYLGVLMAVALLGVIVWQKIRRYTY